MAIYSAARSLRLGDNYGPALFDTYVLDKWLHITAQHRNQPVIVSNHRFFLGLILMANYQ